MRNAILVRMGDKIKRIRELRGSQPLVVNEKLDDTVMDLGVYCFLYLAFGSMCDEGAHSKGG